jgi:hypothetical protein
VRAWLGAGDQASIDADVDAIRLRHEGTVTRYLPAASGVNRDCLKFAVRNLSRRDWQGDSSARKGSSKSKQARRGAHFKLAKLRDRLTVTRPPFLNSPLVTLQNKLRILQSAAEERSLALPVFNNFARGQSREHLTRRSQCIWAR